jgi:hypothetical protein
MIIIKEENENKNNFYERIVNTQNNLFLCKKEKSKLNESNNNIIEYNLNEKIIKNQIKKINKILLKINNNIDKFNDIKYYEKYFKEKRKIKLMFNKKYKKIENITKKILYGGKQNKLLNKANNRRLKDNKIII